MCKGLVYLWTVVSLCSTVLFAETLLVDPVKFEQERAMWEGMAATNRQMAAEIARLESEVARLTALRDSSGELETRVGKMERFAASTATQCVLEWRTSDGKPFLATLAGDDGTQVTFKLLRGQTITIERGKLLAADIEFLDRLRAFLGAAQGLVKEAATEP